MKESEWRRLSKGERRVLKVDLAKKMRAEPTRAERRLIEIVREAVPHSGWCSQKMVCGYIADVASKRLRIVLEADGSAHDGREGYDAKRDEVMRAAGWTVLRFWNETILRDGGFATVKDAVLSSGCGEKIKAEAERRERKRLKNRKKKARKLERIYAAVDAAHVYDKATAGHIRAIMSESPTPAPCAIVP
jgi:very-short-patch-repair endonuclease